MFYHRNPFKIDKYIDLLKRKFNETNEHTIDRLNVLYNDDILLILIIFLIILYLMKLFALLPYQTVIKIEGFREFFTK